MTIWCWVRDLRTGHHYDVPLGRLDHLEAVGAVREIPGRRRRAHAARHPKPFVDKGRRAKPIRTGSSGRLTNKGE
jgi:hypothetical protein